MAAATARRTGSVAIAIRAVTRGGLIEYDDGSELKERDGRRELKEGETVEESRKVKFGVVRSRVFVASN